jgi:GDPmannose 4,6-dehydratase
LKNFFESFHRTPQIFYLFATGNQNSIRDFVVEVFGSCGFFIEWQGEGIEGKGVDRNSGRILIEVDPKLFRPTEVDKLIGDASRARNAREQLKWKPLTPFHELVRIIVNNDLLLKGLDPAKLMISIDK